MATVPEPVVLDRVPGQEGAMAFLRQAAVRPHHAYLLAGPEGCGKQLAVRAFAATLLCARGGCGECRDCRLALDDRHPNEFLVEPEGRDIHVDTIRSEVWHPAYRTAPEPGKKVFVIREADRLNPAAADTLLKVLEEPPADAVIVLLSARPDELPETVLSRCYVVTFQPLAEHFVADTLASEGADPSRALLAARLAGGNLGRARRLAMDPDGLAFRDVGAEAIRLSATGPRGALDAAEVVLEAAEAYRKGLKDRHTRRVKRAERDYVDWVLLGVSSLLRDRVVAGLGGGGELVINLDIRPERGQSPEHREDLAASTRGLAAIEEARAALAEELNLNPRLVLERAFLQLAEAAA